MAVDVNVLRMLKHKDDFRRVFGRIPAAALNKETAAILEDYKKYFNKFPDHDTVDMDVFLPLFRLWHNTLPDDRRAVFEVVLNNARAEVQPDVRQQVMRQILELRLATELGELLTKFDAGDLTNINSAIKELQTSFKADAGISESSYIKDDIHDILDEQEDDNGIKWRLHCLNESMRPLRPGDFGIIAARPDKGKTSFIASELSFMAEQIPDDKNVLWLNNEGLGKRIIPRFWQAVLGANMAEIMTLKRANALKPAFLKRMGRIDKLRIEDIHGKDNYSVEQLIEANNAAIVVYDMIDNIRGFGTESRTDQRLEEMYKWGRDCAVNMGHIGIATSQISVEGDGMQFPTLSMLKDSKTGKQGACDFQLMIGSKNDPAWGQVRWLSLPKNKLRRDGFPGDPRCTVKFDPSRVRFTDLDAAPATSGDDDATDQGSTQEGSE